MKNLKLKTAILLIFLFAITNLTNAQWVQIGQDIDGEAVDDKSGNSVSLSFDGTIVAIGAWGNDGNDGNDSIAGHVRIYECSGGNWIQIGSDIDGEGADDRSGTSVSLSSDGTIVAIGALWNDGNGNNAGHVRIYEYSGGNWIQIGSDIDGEIAGDESGRSVSLSSDGTIVAIGAPNNDGNGNNAGQVKIYEYIGGNWIQIGNNIDGEVEEDNSGISVSLNSDGTIVAIGAAGNDGNGNNSGHVRIYEYNGGNWTQVGSDIDGEATGDWSGGSVSLNYNGTVIAIGAGYNDGNANAAGHVRVYEYNEGNWTQVGNDIDGETSGNLSGFSVSLNSNGNILAIGSPLWHSETDSSIGHVRIYEYSVGNWIQAGNDIDGETFGNLSGYSVSLSSDGTVVAIGAPFNDGNGNSSGHVRVYNFTTGIKENTSNTELCVFPNPTTGKITIQAENIIGVEVMDITGKTIKYTVIASKAKQSAQNNEIATGYHPRNDEIDLSNQPKGIYIIKVTTNKGVVVRKIVLE